MTRIVSNTNKFYVYKCDKRAIIDIETPDDKLQIISITPMIKEDLKTFKNQFLLEKKKIYCPSIVNYENGDVYKGEINKLCQRHGLGELYHKNGDVFAVRWKNNIGNGLGIFISANGRELRGGWDNNRFSGKNNKITHENGDIYKGNVKDNSICGIGEMTYADGDYYSGYWEQNQPNGLGMMKYSDGEIYYGQTVYGEKKGYGVYRWPNGNLYKGDWNNDTFHGKGVLDATHTLGKIYHGDWIHGQQTQQGFTLHI